MANETILVVEDEADILEVVRFNLHKEGYRVVCAKTGEEGLDSARRMHPDLVVLDIMLPGIDGIDVCKVIRNNNETREIPVVMLTAKSDEADIVTGLEVGADDYVVKPFSPRVLSARIKSVLRRRKVQPVDANDVVTIGGMVIDPRRHVVTIDEQTIDLTFTEFGLLHFLARHPGWVFTRYQIVDAVHGENYAVTDRSVDVQVVGLRKKLGDYSELIETVRGVGYRLKEKNG